MKKSFKIGMLAVLLVIPVLVYLFLKFFGENHYRLPRYFPTETFDVEKKGVKVVDTLFHTIPGFNFKNQNGKDISLADLNDKIWVADFFFTRCPGICPVMTSNLTKVQEFFLNSPDFHLVSFSVDAKYDTPEVLKKYGEKFGVDSSKWHLLTGNKQDIFNTGFYGFKLPSDTVDQTLHSEKLVLVDKSKNIRGYYNGTEKEEIDRLITEIKILQYEYKHSEP